MFFVFLLENDYYGQPENIGYGFQKTLGFFDSNGPSTEFGSYNSDPKSENEFQNILYNFYKERDNEKRKTNFRERMSNYRINYPISNRNEADEYSQSGIEYLQLLKNLWSKYRQSQNDDLNVEDLTDEQLEEFLNSINSLNDKGIDEERFVNDYDSAESNDYKHYESIPLRSRKNYRVFEGLSNRRKRYPSFGEGIYGKRSFHSQQNNYENPTENDFLYSLKYITPEVNREAAENLREGGFEVLGDEKDRNVLRILNGALNRPKYFEDDEPYWSKEQNPYDDELWLQGPVTFPDDWYDNSGRNEKRMEVAPKYFKPHNGIHLNSKRFPVKRSSIRVRKEVKSDKDAKELKGIFGTSETTTIPPKKGNEKKPTETVKKQNVTKPAVTKHYEGKKVVRSTDKYTKERVLPARQNEEIADLFSPTKKLISKKSIDWSQYFGIDKRSHPNWLKNDYLARAESHFLAPKNKRFFPSEAAGIGSGSFLDRPQYQMPFDTRKFNKKSYPTDIGSNIDKVENKIGDIEEKIIDDALKYTGAHSGYGSDDLSKVKSRVIQHLEAAYSLEKMKNALEEFKNLIKPDKSSETINLPKKTTTEAPKSEPQTTGTS